MMNINEGINNDQPEDIAVIADNTSTLLSEEVPLVRIKGQFDLIRKNFLVLIGRGDKQYKDLSKRARLMMVSFVIPLAYLLVKMLVIKGINSILLSFYIAIAVGFLTYLGILWGFKAQVRKESYFTVIPLVTLFSMASSMFLGTIFVGVLDRVYLWVLFVIGVAVYMLSLYIMSLAANVLNVSLFYTIPLSRLGESVMYIYSVVTVFLTVYIFNTVSIPLLMTHKWALLAFSSSILLVFIILLTTCLLMFFLPMNSNSWVAIIVVSCLITLFIFLLSIITESDFSGATLTAIISYVLFGFLIHKQQNTFKIDTKVEYFLLILVGFVLVFV